MNPTKPVDDRAKLLQPETRVVVSLEAMGVIENVEPFISVAPAAVRGANGVRAVDHLCGGGVRLSTAKARKT